MDSNLFDWGPGGSAMPTERRRLVYSGSVQGVGFRMTARRLASGFPISGYVRNLEDGSVELLVEGGPETVTAYLQAIRREFEEMIRDVQETEAEAGPLNRFEIRH